MPTTFIHIFWKETPSRFYFWNNYPCRWYSVVVSDWSVIEIVQLSATNNDCWLLPSGGDYWWLLKPLIRQSPTHRRVIKDNLRPLPTSLIGRMYLVLPRKPTADKNCQKPSEDHYGASRIIKYLPYELLGVNKTYVRFEVVAIFTGHKPMCDWVLGCQDWRLKIKGYTMFTGSFLQKKSVGFYISLSTIMN